MVDPLSSISDNFKPNVVISAHRIFIGLNYFPCLCPVLHLPRLHRLLLILFEHGHNWSKNFMSTFIAVKQNFGFQI